jgi:hypothetical protein
MNWRSAIAAAIAMVTSSAAAQPAEHAVIVHFRYGSTDLAPLFALEDKLQAAIEKARAGEFDGKESESRRVRRQ